MSSLGAPRTPAFSLLCLSAALGAASQWTVVALLPFFVPSNASATSLATAVASFHIPSLFLHPLLHSSQPRPSFVFPAVALLDACAAALFAIAASTSQSSAAPPSSVESSTFPPLLLTTGMFLAGMASALFQSRIVDHVASALPSEENSLLSLAIHVSVVDAAAILAAALAPLFVAASLYVQVPLAASFWLLNIALLVVAPVVVHVLTPAAQRHMLRDRTYDLNSPRSPTAGATLESDPLLNPAVPPGVALVTASGTPNLGLFSDEVTGTVQTILRSRRTMLPLLAMFVSAASVALLRPVLAVHLLTDLHIGPLRSALAFAVFQIGALVANHGATALAEHIDRRLIVIAGLMLAAVGFKCLSAGLWTIPSVFLLSLGGNAAQVVTVGDLSNAGDAHVSGAGLDALTLVSFVVMAAGEVAGVMFAGLSQDALGTFDAALLVWARIIAGIVLLLILPEIATAWRRAFVATSAATSRGSPASRGHAGVERRQHVEAPPRPTGILI